MFKNIIEQGGIRTHALSNYGIQRRKALHLPKRSAILNDLSLLRSRIVFLIHFTHTTRPPVLIWRRFLIFYITLRFVKDVHQRGPHHYLYQHYPRQVLVFV